MTESLSQEAINILRKPSVWKWFEENTQGKNPTELVNVLELAVRSGKLTIRDALILSQTIGQYWESEKVVQHVGKAS